MWFKNLRVYRLNNSIKHTPEALNEALSQFEFKPCGSVDAVSYGWAPPLGRDGSELVHAANGYIMICAKRQEKVLPGPVVKELLDEKVAEISAQEARFVGRAEKQSLKEEIIFSLMPRAFVKSAYDFAYVDTKNQMLIVNTGSANRAEEIMALLRETLGSLKAVPLLPLNPPREVLTNWLRLGDLPNQIQVGEECELSALEDGRSVKFKNQDLWIEEVGRHISSGLQVSKLLIKWNDSIECIIDEELCFKRIKYGNAISEQAKDYDADSAAAVFDNEFSVMTLELTAFIKAMADAFGGVDEEVFALKR